MTDPLDDGATAARWGLALLVIVGLHAAAAWSWLATRPPVVASVAPLAPIEIVANDGVPVAEAPPLPAEAASMEPAEAVQADPEPAAMPPPIEATKDPPPPEVVAEMGPGDLPLPPPVPAPPAPRVPAKPRLAVRVATVAPPAPAPPVAAAQPASSAAPAAAEAKPTDGAALATWQARVLAHLERFKRYPADAARQRHEGTPMVRLRMARGGEVLAARLVQGSGHGSLDAEALAWLERAAPLPALPPDVARDAVELVIPLRFLLR